MGFLIIAIVFTFAVKAAFDKGKREYAHTRDSQAAEISRAHPGWSPGKVGRHARRRARGYWWDQIRRGFPDLKAAYEEDRLVAEAERSKAALDGEKRRKELRDQIREALEEHHRLKEEERQAEEARRTAPHTPDSAGEPTPDAPAEPSTPDNRDRPRADADAAAPTDLPDDGTCPECDETAPDGPAPADDPPGTPAGPDANTTAPVRPHLRPVPDHPGDTDPTLIDPSGGAPVTNNGMGDALGYEQILAAYNADVERRSAEVERMQTHVADLEQADAAYEAQMAMLRTAKADDETIEQVAALREANEQQIVTGREAATAAHDGLTRSIAARDDWVSRHGAVHDTKAATGARGDEVLYTT